MKDSYYFVIRLTENEHYCVASQIKQYCLEKELVPIYYRKISTGHVPMYREVKIKGNRSEIGKLKQFMVSEHIKDFIVDDFWEKRKEEDKRLELRLKEYTAEELELFRKRWPPNECDEDKENMFFL
jgi:hypothetical protein